MMTIGDASRRSGIHIETIRYFEREGLLPAPARSATGRRLYSEDDIGVLTFVSRCRDLGFRQADIRTLLALRNAPEESCGEVRQVAAGHLEDTRARIAGLRRLEAALASLIAECRDGRTACPALETLFSDRGA